MECTALNFCNGCGSKSARSRCQQCHVVRARGEVGEVEFECSTTARASRKGSDPGAVIARRGRIPHPAPLLSAQRLGINERRARNRLHRCVH